MPKTMPSASTGVVTIAELTILADEVESLISFDKNGKLLIGSQHIDNEDIIHFIIKVHELTQAILE